MKLKTALRIAGVAWIVCGLTWLGTIGSKSLTPAIIFFISVSVFELVFVRALGRWEENRSALVGTPIKVGLILASIVLAVAISPPVLRQIIGGVTGPQNEAECLQEAKSSNSDFIAKKIYRECVNRVFAAQEQQSFDKSQCVADSFAFKSTPPANEKMREVRAKLAELNGMDDQRALRYLHNAYYSDLPIEQLAKQLGMTLPPPYREGCMNQYPDLYK